MSALYEESHRQLQRQFDTQRLADRIEERLFRTALTDDDRAFIERLDLFFLATVNSRGEPSCSYKGGDPGFVRVLDARTLAFPCYDGNGMFLSMGNVAATRARRHAVHRPLLAETAARERHGAHRAGRVRRAAFPGSAVRRRRRHSRSVSELPALHTQVRARRAFEIRAARRHGDAGSRLETDGLGVRRIASQ